MTAPSSRIVEVCHEYARLECAARAKRNASPLYPAALRASMRMLYDEAPREAWSYLDAVKKVFEIDSHVQDINSVLLRASVIR